MQSTEEPLSVSESNRELIKLIVIIAALALILGSFILYLSWPLMTGKTIVLATQPIDPFDPLRGQYITIRYEISAVIVPANVSEGDYVYVSLAEDKQGISRAAGASLQPPREGTFIRGKIERLSGGNAQVLYGIEQYFFERNAQFETQGIQVEARVSSDGQARITQLLRDGEPIEITYQKKSFTS